MHRQLFESSNPIPHRAAIAALVAAVLAGAAAIASAANGGPQAGPPSIGVPRRLPNIESETRWIHRSAPIRRSVSSRTAAFHLPPHRVHGHPFVPQHGFAPRKPIDDEKPIGALTADILPPRGELPPNYAAARFEKEPRLAHTTGTSRTWGGTAYLWEAPAICHGPLHFEEPNAERLGHSFGLFQPLVSGAHFFARIPAMPYKMTVYPPHECIYTLGHYRPGSHAPYRYIRLPLSAEAALVQAGATYGLVALIP